MTLISLTPTDPAGLVVIILGGFSERKNPEYNFLRKGTKAVGPLS